MEFPVPENLVAACREDGREAWLETLPATVCALCERWDIEVTEPYRPGGQTAWVAPARRRPRTGPATTSTDLVLKVVWKHTEALHEAEGLRSWAGEGAVLLFAAEEVDAGTSALLIERCRPGTTLGSLPEPEQDEVVAGILRQLWVEPAPASPFRPLQAMCDEWADDFDSKLAAGRCPLDLGLAREGIALYRALPSSADCNVLLATDLHAGNVLAAERRPWLAIDPKPYVGDPAYDTVQHMLNCEARLLADPRRLSDRMAGLLDLDRDRVAGWLFARCVQESPGWPVLRQVAERLGHA